MDEPSSFDQTAEYWDRELFSPVMQRAEWQNHPLVLQRLSRLLGAETRVQWFIKNCLPPNGVARGLGIGVGAGGVEIEIAAAGAVRHFDLWDVSPAGLQAAREYAGHLHVLDRIETHLGDVSVADLGDSSYDVITFISSLHHIEDLDGVLAKCRRALKPGGVLWAAEYVGPDRFAYPEDHVSLAKSLFFGIDPVLRKSWEAELRFPTRDEVIAADPTESIHSSMIPAALSRHFEDLQKTPVYGSFAFIMFWGLNHDAIYERPEGDSLVSAILQIDEALIDSGKLPHYFMYFVARKPTS